MSTTIDQRVVEMRFDNQHFEKNVATTMSTLDKLKQKLHLDGATKGLENVNSAAKNVKMDNLGGAVETVSAKFSALQVMGVTALANITNSAVNAGKRIVSALTIDPIKTGLSEYETKMNAIQVIQANTRSQYTTEELTSGKQMNDITSALDELNTYADKTIYNFAQMTSNVGKFVAQGLDVHEASKAVQGLANLAAASGASAEDMARATYQMSQALGGTIRLIDWNSLRNANMATVDLKNTLMDLARVNGIAIDDMIKKHGTFEQTLSEGWLSGAMFSEAMNIYSGVYSEAELKAKGFTDAQVENFISLSKMAESAATEVKTFTQLWDVLKETAQSGWTQTWELIVGDFDTAKKTLTQLQNYLSEIINGWSKARNWVVEGVLNFTKPWTTIMEKLDGAGLGGIQKLVDNVKGATKTLEEFQEIVNKVWRGDYSTAGGDPDRYDLLEKAGWNHKVVQDLVNKGHQYKLTMEDVEASHKKFGLTMDKTAESTKDSSKAVDAMTFALENLSDEQLEQAGLTKDEIKLFRDIAKEAKRTGVSFDELVEKMSTVSGRSLLIDSIKNAWSGLLGIAKALGSAIAEIFPAPSIPRIYTMIESINKFSEKLRLTDKETGKLNETGQKIQRTFKGILSIFDIIITVLGGPLKWAFEIVTDILGQLGLTVLDITAGLGDAITSLRDNIDRVVGAITKLIVDNVAEWIKQFKETEFFKTIAKWFQDAGDAISGAFETITDKISNFNASAIGNTLGVIIGFFKSIGTAIGNSEWFGKVVDGFTSAFDKLKSFFGNFKLPEFNLENLKTFSSDIVKIGEKITGLGGKGFTGAITGFGKHLKDNVFSWNWTVFKETALEKFVNFLLKTGDVIKKGFEIAKEIVTKIKEFIFGAEEVNLPTIIDLVTKVLWVVALIKAIKLMDTVVSPLDNISDALDNWAASLKWDSMASAFKSMALALAAFTICIVVLTQMPDMKKAWSAAGMLIALMVVMGTVVTVMGLVASKVDGGLNAAGVAFSLLTMIGSIVLLVYAIKEIDQLELKNPGKTIATMVGVILAMTVGVRMVSKAAGSSFRSVAAILTLMAALKLILEVVDSYDQFDWSGKSRAIDKMLEMMLYLSLAIRIASGGTKAGASSTGLALTLIAMVASLKILIGVIEDFAAMPEDVLIKGGTVIAGIIGLMTLMLSIVNLSSKGTVLEKGQRNVNNFTGLAVALLAVVAAIWLLGKMDYETLKQGGFAVGQILILFTAMLTALGLACSGLKIGPIITMLLAIGLLMAEVTVIIKLLEAVPWQNSLSSAGALAAVLLSMAFALRTISKTETKVSTLVKWIGAMTALAGIISILAFVLYSIKSMNPLSAIGNAVALGGLLAVMAGVLHILSALDMRKLSTKKMGKLGLIFVGMTAVLALLGLVLAMMSALKISDAIPNAIALSTLISVLTGVLTVLSFLKVNKNTFTAVGAIALLGVVVLELGFFLHLMDGWNIGSMLPTIGALSALLVVLTGVMAVCAAMGTIAGSSVGGLAATVVAIGVLGAVVLELGYFLSIIKGYAIGGMMPEVQVLSAMLIVLTGVMVVCTIFGTVAMASWGGLIATVAAIGVLGAVVLELGYFLSIIKGYGIGGMLPEVQVLSAMLTVLTGVMVVCTLFGTVAMASWAGLIATVAAIAVLGAVVLELGYFLSLIKPMGIGEMLPEVTILSAMLMVLTGIMAVCTVIGFAAGAAIAGVTALAIFIAELTALVTAIGWLMSDPKLADFLDTGIESLKKLARGIGEIISEFGAGLTSSLPEIGDNLSGFAENLDTFLATMERVDDGVAENAAKLAEAILTLTAGDLINTFTSLFNGDEGSSLSTLGTELSTFGKNAGDFIAAMDGMKPETATSMSSFVSAIESLNAVCGNNNFGDGALEAFGTSVASFAMNMKEVAGSLSELTDTDVENIKRAAVAAGYLVELNASIPKTGGLWQDIAGSADLASWGQKISAFADSLVAYSGKVSGKNIDSEAIKTSANAATAISDLNASIPKADGLWQSIAGSQDLANWGQKIAAFADALVTYSGKVSAGTIDKDAIIRSCEAATELAKLNDAIPESDGVWQWLTGEKDMATFGTSLTSLATGLVNYANAAVQIDDTKIEAIKRTGTAIDEINLVVDKISKTGGIGDWFTGTQDPEAYGNGIRALALGIRACCNVAASITDPELESISKLGTAVDNLKAVLEKVPETTDSAKTASFKTAVTDIRSICATLNTISTAGYDYSGIDTLKANIGKLTGILSELNTMNITSGFNQLATATHQADRVASYLAGLSGYSYAGIDTFKGAISSLASTNVDGVISTFSGKAEQMKLAVSDMVTAMTTGFSGGTDDVKKAMSDLLESAIKAGEGKADEGRDVGSKLGKKLAEGVESEESAASSAGKSLGAKAASGAKQSHSSMTTAGGYLGDGLVSGINSKKYEVYWAGYALGAMAVKGEKDGQASNSPSKATIKAGGWLGEGLVIGMNRMGSAVYEAGKSMGNEGVRSISNSISKISSLVESGMDAQPTIRPVLDLSDVQSGIAAMGGMFGSSSIGVNANLGSISSMMNQRSQNGANDDVISAINGLRRDLANVNNTTYQINGITYDDGSNVSSAVKQIARAALMERRV